jgi:SAM-dependent methyltransferase
MLSLDQQATDAAAAELRTLLAGMRDAFARGGNAMEYARSTLGRNENLSAATLIAYDLQAGAYVRHALSDPDGKRRPCAALGFDISWSRCAHGRGWLRHKAQQADLFVADLFHIPLEDDSVDVVYTSHSLEPNGGREQAALQELLRVARRAVVLVEPIYELAGPEARERMTHHGYVRNLKATAEALGYPVTGYGLLDFYVNPLNPSGVVCIEKSLAGDVAAPGWRCPLTHAPLVRSATAFASPDTGLVYPVLDGIPLLCRDHAVLASAYGHPVTP